MMNIDVVRKENLTVRSSRAVWLIVIGELLRIEWFQTAF